MSTMSFSIDGSQPELASSSPSSSLSTNTSLELDQSSTSNNAVPESVRKRPILILRPPKPEAHKKQLAVPKTLTAVQRRIARGRSAPTANYHNYPESRLPLAVAVWLAQKIDLVTNKSFLDQVLSDKDQKKSKKEKEKIAQRLRKTRSRMTNWAKNKENDCWGRATAVSKTKKFATKDAKKDFINASALKEYRHFIENAVGAYSGKLINLPVFRFDIKNVVFPRTSSQNTPAVTELGRSASTLLRCLIVPTHTPKSVHATADFITKLDAADDDTIRQTLKAFTQSPDVVKGVEIVLAHCYERFGTIKRKARRS